VRGIVSVAAALAIPFTIANGAPFPARDMILFLTYVVVLVTLVGQGLLLPGVIHALGLAHAGRRERHAERVAEYEARRAALSAALERLDALATERDLPDEVVKPLRAHTRDQIRTVDNRRDGDAGHRKQTELREDIELELIAAERVRINELFRTGDLTDEARRRIERALDLREADLANRRPEP
jgi:CPA1 family monovalent cation:H+ antiporter